MAVVRAGVATRRLHHPNPNPSPKPNPSPNPNPNPTPTPTPTPNPNPNPTPNQDLRYGEKKDFLSQQGLGDRLSFPLLIDRYSSELLQVCTSKRVSKWGVEPHFSKGAQPVSRWLGHYDH